jgi:hypothetical protein
VRRLCLLVPLLVVSSCQSKRTRFRATDGYRYNPGVGMIRAATSSLLAMQMFTDAPCLERRTRQAGRLRAQPGCDCKVVWGGIFMASGPFDIVRPPFSQCHYGIGCVKIVRRVRRKFLNRTMGISKCCNAHMYRQFPRWRNAVSLARHQKPVGLILK